ncbi:MAG: hypothetical protein ACQES9_12310 [Myxococcota bacterium]
MEKNFISFLDSPDGEKYFGRIRTLHFLDKRCDKICHNLPFKTKIPKLKVISHYSGWEFIDKNNLNWLTSTEHDNNISNELKRYPLPENLAKNLKKFLQNKIPGPLVIRGILNSEDMGLPAAYKMFQPRFIMDPPANLQTRFSVLSSAIKNIWAQSLSKLSKAFFKILTLPHEDQMATIMISEPELPHRGSFYYPDLSVVLWAENKNSFHGLCSGGIWDPAHKKFPVPVEFIPGQAIEAGPDTLLAFDPQKSKLISISSHLAKTHGTKNLPIITESMVEKQKTKKKKQYLATSDSALSRYTKTICQRLWDELQTPFRLLFCLQPEMNKGENTVYLNSIRTFTPPFTKVPFDFPELANIKQLFNSKEVVGTGSGIIRYLIHLKKDSLLARKKLNHLLQYLHCKGYGALLAVKDIKSLSSGSMAELLKHPAITVIYSENSPPGSWSGDIPVIVSPLNKLHLFSSRFLEITDSENKDEFTIHTAPNPVLVTTNQKAGKGMGWF